MTILYLSRDLHNVGDLRGVAAVLLRPTTVFIDDPPWERAIGMACCMEGGAELDVRAERLGEIARDACPIGDLPDATLIPVRIRDVYYPPAAALVPLGVLLHDANLIAPGTGVRAQGERVPCRRRCGRCLSCFYDRWTARAQQRGVPAPEGG